MERQEESGFDELSVAEKILVVQDLWDRIAQHPVAIEVTDEQRAELDKRLRAHRADPDAATAWEDALARIRTGR